MDIQIIGSFYFEGVKNVYSLDRGFRETCKKLDINILKLPIEFIGRMKRFKENQKKKERERIGDEFPSYIVDETYSLDK